MCKNDEAMRLLKHLEELLKQDDKNAIYDFMSDEFKSGVSLEHYLRLEKYRIDLSLPLCLAGVYENGDKKIMLRVKQFSKSKPDDESFANILFVKENDEWKLSGILV